MADIVKRRDEPLPDGMKLRWRDMGDGTYARTHLPLALSHAAVHADDVVEGWLNGTTGYDTQTVITDSSFYTDVPEGYIVYVTDISANLGTASDWLKVEWGWTDATGGGGTFNVESRVFYLSTGNSPNARTLCVPSLVTPYFAKYEDGARSWTARVQTNDASAEVYLGYRGYLEPYHGS